MAKEKTRYTCTACGGASSKWLGKCPACGEWDTLVEEAVAHEESRASRASLGGSAARPVTELAGEREDRSGSGDAELDRILGGGLVAGSAVLLGGDPGIGKSTLLLQAALARAAAHPGPVLYVTAEESATQVRLRAERLGTLVPGLLVLAENNVNRVLREAERVGAGLVVIDSIQMVYWPEMDSAPGSVSQVRECAAGLIAQAKRCGAPVVLVGHVTKEGAIAGPKVLEHMVDVVLYFEGDRHHTARILRSVKNRFGATGEIGVFEMAGTGLRAVDDPSRLFLSAVEGPVEGAVVTAAVEGTRPFLAEVQALATAGLPGGARRRITGADANRVSMLLAVLEKRCGLSLADQDVFVNVVGGVRLEEPSADLAIALAVASSLQERAVPRDLAVVGEVGLGGEVRPAGNMDLRLREAVRLGFRRALLPAESEVELPGLSLQPVRRLEEALELLGERVAAATE
jgi:DNA repair protein RadA/Sms